MPYIRVTHIWTDDNGMIQIEIQASNGTLVAAQDFYVYPETIIRFCKALAEFPFIQNNKACLEYGADPKYYCHFCLSAVLLNSQGHSAFKLQYLLANPLDIISIPSKKNFMWFFVSWLFIAIISATINCEFRCSCVIIVHYSLGRQ